MRACSFCKGEGQVSSEAAERWRMGQAMRDARVKRGLTQQQEAEWLGISPRELNAIELGRLSFEQVNTRSL
jgi:ribosome-binding protein aMBF1 (putative translation factor)